MGFSLTEVSTADKHRTRAAVLLKRGAACRPTRRSRAVRAPNRRERAFARYAAPLALRRRICQCPLNKLLTPTTMR